MKRVLFLDPTTPTAYTGTSLVTGGLGGTEATVIRVAEKLAETDFVMVVQAPRTAEETVNNVTYAPIEATEGVRFDAVVVLRDPAMLAGARLARKDIPIYFWMHDWATPTMLPYAKMLKPLGVTVVCVSRAHKTQVTDLLSLTLAPEEFPRITFIYNPIDDNLKPDATPVDKNKLVFFSSPHKGLTYALSIFPNVTRFNPDFRLFVSNPGYLPSDATSRPSVVNCGVLSHRDIIQHVRESLCVFYPNHVFPETFGLVLAEANAVGTPVLTHALGAAREVLDHPSQLVDTRDLKQLIDRLMYWYAGNRPIVRANPDFRVTAVARKWKEFINV